MDLDQRLAISYYKPIAAINEPHHVYLVQHQETKKIAIKKVLDVYNLAVYAELYRNPIAGTPRIINYYEEANSLLSSKNISPEHPCRIRSVMQT